VYVFNLWPGREPVYKPAVRAGDDHHGGERAAPRTDHQGPVGRHGGCPPRQRVAPQHDHPLVTTPCTSLKYVVLSLS